MSWTDMAINGRILVVDDAMENIQILHAALQDEHEVLFALDGARALELARTQQPDLILLDAVMPDIDGYVLCRELLAAPETADIPIVFVTALSSPEDETRALEAGAADFISKPVNAAVVRARVRTQLTVKRQRDALRALILVDALTGVANRRAFDERLDAEWRRCSRSGLPVALMLVDIDHFKLYNDHYGHPGGDATLVQVAGAMRRAAGRSQDLVARYGGEEFAILLPQLDAQGASGVARRLMAELDHMSIPHAASPTAPHLTASMGIACMVPGEHSFPADLIQVADALLYQAKAGGRNRYRATAGCVAGPDPL
ncbi:diguanylate cyclase domain-containing protein [Herbaspirillum sp. SJZ107]|uniref:diguanylate cyclase domain-containing protein n=1 Tax=Herbaspirillum sp. SJZ107 TaxID=2572881 RepID=UPI00115198F3|nr:diguanylate cyclase [Herbaspirillum sp. SJZ107]TQK11171.1 response regulator receiver modulated diguanylate cyclase [Herbaspirillum sp. SJZ107]